MKKIVNIREEYNYSNDDNTFIKSNENKVETLIYEYSELTEVAQKNARIEMEQDKINSDIGSICFNDFLDYVLKEKFPKSDIKYQYSLNSCQGDGLNLYGELNLYDILDKIQDKFDLKELKYLNWLFSTITDTYNLEENCHYNYCICDRQNVLEDIVVTMQLDCYRDIKYEVIEKFEELTKEYLYKLCKDYENIGYEEIYNLNDGDIEYYIENGIMFYEDGNIYSY